MNFDINILTNELKELNLMKKKPKKLFYIGDLNLLNKRKVSIVGTRRPSQYTKEFTFKLALELSKRDIVIVSGAAMGVDAIAHQGAKNNTIAVMANGLDILYPAINRTLIENIYKNSLALSFFENGFSPTKWSFVLRNELVVALGDILIVTEADLNSGSLRSVEFALRMKKTIYVLPHRINESLGTNKLIKNNLVKVIYDVEEFVNSFGEVKQNSNSFLDYLKTNPTLEEAILKVGDKIYEAELDGIIIIEYGKIKYIS